MSEMVLTGGRTSSDMEDICTVHVSNFPMDMRERELENLVRFLPGYQGIVLSGQTPGLDDLTS